MAPLYIILFGLGLIVGSFLNVVAFRYNPEESLFGIGHLTGRSKCRSCQKKLRWYELIPIFSFFVLRGRCGSCKEKISWQYPIVELLTGLATMGVPYVFSKMFFIKQVFLAGGPIGWFAIISIIWIWIFYLFILLALIDFRLKIIPNEINVILFLLGVGILGWQFWYDKFDLASGTFLGGYAAMFGFREDLFLNHLLAGLVAGGLFGLAVFLTKGKGMGMGDVKLAFVLGWLFGWPDVVLLIVIAFILGGVFGVGVIVSKKGKGMKMTVPFGPFLVLAGTLVFYLGESILVHYFSWFGII